MFTGLVEGLGRVERIVEENGGRRLTIVWPGLSASEPLELGESVAVSGCCLTVIAATAEHIPRFRPGRKPWSAPTWEPSRPAIASTSSGA